ncbi:MAG: lysophospholipid acyltransferase family protein [Alphaproteobacteria bacterium]|nr:lysophospholipid acyltransferase family protein [Alphaproteobacteria bacterium]
MSELQVRAAKREWYERWFKDPAVGFLAIFLWGLFRILPLDVASWLGGWLGRAFSVFLPEKKKVALFNLKRCFPEKTEEEHKKILAGMWEHLGRMAGELSHGWGVGKRVKVVGAEHFEEARTRGKGGFIASGHVGNWELCGPVLMKFGIILHPVYRAANNPWIEKFIFSHRKIKGMQLIPKGTAGARLMIELLRNKEYIGILCDQKLREGIDVPFFGYPARTAPAVATLALKCDLSIVPTRIIREKGAHYTCYFSKALDLPNTGDKTADTYQLMLTINKILEDWIKEHPEQWLWIHHRWDKAEYSEQDENAKKS